MLDDLTTFTIVDFINQVRRRPPQTDSCFSSQAFEGRVLVRFYFWKSLRFVSESLNFVIKIRNKSYRL